MIVIKFNDTPQFGECCVACDNEPMPWKDSAECVVGVKSIIGCKSIDIVDIGHFIDLFVDDEGLMKPNPKPNWIATALRTIHWVKSNGEILVPAGYPPLCGVCVALSHNDEGETVDLNEEQVKYLEGFLK